MCIQMKDYNIIIEVDEEQHNDYEAICENKRTMELFMDLGHKPLVMIRFNPDDYLNTQKVRVKSCWSLDSKNKLVVKKDKQDEWKTRLNNLKETLNYHLHNFPTREVETSYLYYDEITEVCNEILE
jgi:hypothetical protein